ncbi:M23 family metallopeptidase [Aquihabitans sp. G128]|uniref:M23 family metallopeptidase n=1 Tax=Aquihabitans sp. G128 TaxID=2849779 RepID=UPI001C2273DF|nr:M23 family metallopeptidase [Aquihabitans sp. G128]QXC59232.1 M23 family metallopeptidase [Aquihabitans sp. G128]
MASRPSRIRNRALAPAAALLLAAATLASGARPGAADPQPPKVVPEAVPATPVPSTPAGPAPSGPVWLPLRHDANGGEVKIGCTYDSHGSQFGYECSGHHDRWALDLIADAGTPVYASGAGFATDGTGAAGGSGYGNNVRVDHGNGVQTIYAHLSKVLVPAGGAWVDENTEIGLVGSTGSSSANHLHYEVRKTAPDGSVSSVDPGPLKACALGTVVEYPAIRGYDSWKGLPWGAFTLFSDGTDCAQPDAAAPAPTDEAAASDAASGLAGGLPSNFLLLALAELGHRPTGG